jgi:hypothetical protein
MPTWALLAILPLCASGCVVPTRGNVCPPLVERSPEWRNQLADELDAVDEASRDAGLIVVIAGQFPAATMHRTLVDAIVENARRIEQLRMRRIDQAVEELGQLRAAVRAVCPNGGLVALENSR